MPGIDLDDLGALQEMDDLDIRPPARMILPDVNVLIYAFRKDFPRHSGSKPWLDKVIRGDAQFGLSPLALSAVARIVTNPRVFKEPSPIEEAFAFCDNLLGQPHCEVVRPGSRHWTIFTRICLEFERSRASKSPTPGLRRSPSSMAAHGSRMIATTPAFLNSTGGPRPHDLHVMRPDPRLHQIRSARARYAALRPRGRACRPV